MSALSRVYLMIAVVCLFFCFDEDTTAQGQWVCFVMFLVSCTIFVSLAPRNGMSHERPNRD